jgi:uncharacterized protein YbbC (DUF1343 family)
MKLQKLILITFIFAPFLLSAQIKTGADRVEIYLPKLENKRVAICGNQTSKIGNIHLVDTLLSLKVHIVKIFAPEHGFRGDSEAGALINSEKDPKTGLPIVSLYGNNKKPTSDQLKNIDIIIFDIQDVGCRFYTYISTLHYIMEAAAESHVKVMIFDRPNPNGYFIDGPVLEEKFKSFVGMHPVPVVHGMTIGEYGMMINGENWLPNGIKCELEVIPMSGYDHTMRYSLPYPPSPNLTTDESIYLYPSLCFFEGTCVSLGRGTEIPFQIYGNPVFREGDYYFIPQPIKGISENPPLNGKKCRGFNLTEFAKENLTKHNRIEIEFIIHAYHIYPDSTKFFTNPPFFDKLAGNSSLRWQIIKGKSEEEIRDSWQTGISKFKVIRKKYLLYPDFE